MPTYEQIDEILLDFPRGITARRIANILHATRHEINHMLYNNPNRYQIDENYYWRIIDVAPQEDNDFLQPDVSDDIDALSQRLDNLWEQRERLNDEIKEIRERLASKMADNGVSSLQTDNLRIRQRTDYIVNIERQASTQVYELLEDNGYDCMTYNSLKRKNAILHMIDEDGILPEWLNELVDISEKKVIDITPIQR